MLVSLEFPYMLSYYCLVVIYGLMFNSNIVPYDKLLVFNDFFPKVQIDHSM